MATDSSDTDDVRIKSAQLEKINAETEKLRTDKRKIELEMETAAKQAGFSYWAEIIKITGAVILGLGGFITAASSLAVSWQKVDQAKDEFKKAQAEIQEANKIKAKVIAESNDAIRARDLASKEAADKKKEVEEYKRFLNANKNIPEGKLVYVQFQGGLQRQLINELRQSLNTKGYSAPGAERLAGKYSSTVKYFHESDKAAADKLVHDTEAFFAAKRCPVKLSSQKSQSPAGYTAMELWLSHTCKGV